MFMVISGAATKAGRAAVMGAKKGSLANSLHVEKGTRHA